MNIDERIQEAVIKVPTNQLMPDELLSYRGMEFTLRHLLDEGVIAFVEVCRVCNGRAERPTPAGWSHKRPCTYCNGTGKVVSR